MRPVSGKPRGMPLLDASCEDHAVENRVLLLNLVTALLIVGGALMWMSWTGSSMEPGMAILGFVLAGLHLAAAVGTALRRRWGRLLGLVVGWIGVLGSGAVLFTLVAALGAAGLPLPRGGSWLSALLIPGGMVAAYLVIVVVLLRNRGAFDGELSSQLG